MMWLVIAVVLVLLWGYALAVVLGASMSGAPAASKGAISSARTAFWLGTGTVAVILLLHYVPGALH